MTLTDALIAVAGVFGLSFIPIPFKENSRTEILFFCSGFFLVFFLVYTFCVIYAAFIGDMVRSMAESLR
jgi:hypothetical protein